VEFNHLYYSPNVIQVFKSRRTILVGHVTLMEERRRVNRVLVGNLRQRDHLEDSGIDG
jgi:hypothetical protein